MLAPLVSLALVAAPLTLAAPEFQGAQVKPEVVRFASEHVAQRLTAHGIRVVTSRQIATLLGMERQRQLMGCAEDDASCTLELGNALGAEVVMLGDLAQLGRTFVVNVKVMRSRDGLQLAAASVTAASEDALPAALDQAADSLRDQLRPLLPAEARPSGGLRRLAWVPAVAGGAALAVGGVFLGLSVDTHNQLRDTRPDAPPLDAAAAARAGETQQAVAWAGFGVGTAALLTAGAFLVFGGPRDATPAVALVPGGAVVGIGGVLP